MDELDHQLIARLRSNARSSVAALAKQLQVARGTIQNRIAKLEREGTIAGYTVRLGSQLDVPGISALMTIAVDGNRADALLRSLRGDRLEVSDRDCVAGIDLADHFEVALGRFKICGRAYL